MSTQHPDNVSAPFFSAGNILEGEDEIQEAYYTLSHLLCDEQMWDCEGKEADDFVVKKLLSRYGQYFRSRRIGRDAFITLRVPNPDIERPEAKVLLETLESIPRSFDVARLFYGDDAPPIFEVIMPMTVSARCLERVRAYYEDFVIGKQGKPFFSGDIKIREWFGEFKPERINVIPLYEDMERILSSAEITREYLEGKSLPHQRVFLARSDPAMNYGLVSALLLNKIALMRLGGLSESSGTRIYPIIGVGSAPFRGNLRPSTVERVLSEYAGAHTFTVQSAFKYDNPPERVQEAVKKIRAAQDAPPQQLEEQECLRVVAKYSQEYQRQVSALAPLINLVARLVPGRRKRKMHIGLFGYSRSMGGVSLPRAITFTAALYSVGLPPELLALNSLDARDMDAVRASYKGFDMDISDALAYFNPASGFVPEGVAKAVKEWGFDFKADEEHLQLSSHIAESVKRSRLEDLASHVLRAANIRKFLG
jgi:phosphoenolpyruvate carboxylase